VNSPVRPPVTACIDTKWLNGDAEYVPIRQKMAACLHRPEKVSRGFLQCFLKTGSHIYETVRVGANW
jgi:hypothetical protein